MDALRQNPTLLGLCGGPLLLACARWLAYQMGRVVAPNLTEGLSNGLMYISLPALLLGSLLMGAVLGGLSAQVAAGWYDRDAGRVARVLPLVRLVALTYLAWTLLQTAVTLKALSSTTTTVFHLPSADPLSWQGPWVLFSLLTNIPLLWALGLTVVGSVLQRLLSADAEQDALYSAASLREGHRKGTLKF